MTDAADRERTEPRAEEGPGAVWVSVLLAGAALLAAALGGRAALLSDRGSDTYTGAIRQHVQRAAAVVEDIRFVYDDEASFALRVVIAETRAEELRRRARRARGEVRTALEVEAAAQDQVAEIVRSASEVAQDPAYRLEGGGLDLGRRLADRRAESPELVALDPDAPEEEAASFTLHAALAVAATIPVSLAFMFGALSQGFPRRRRPFLAAGFAALGVGLVLGVLLEVWR